MVWSLTCVLENRAWSAMSMHYGINGEQEDNNQETLVTVFMLPFARGQLLTSAIQFLEKLSSYLAFNSSEKTVIKLKSRVVLCKLGKSHD
ncbi:hypothetical protein GRJ2_001403700 [Grus japonensis]|uniref:Uncharacterized protein n=1 Tax=Grus japonensis TaxID=30415 RepID=A0ABC9WX59_GRUJA